MAHFINNTDKEYPCTNCGTASGNIVREGTDPKLKCLSCGFLFLVSDSESAKNAGQLPTEPIRPSTQTLDESTIAKLQVRANESNVQDSIRQQTSDRSNIPTTSYPKLPRSPSYVFLTKDRRRSEFCSKKYLKSITLRWESEGLRYDVFELVSKKVETKINIE